MLRSLLKKVDNMPEQMVNISRENGNYKKETKGNDRNLNTVTEIKNAH